MQFVVPGLVPESFRIVLCMFAVIPAPTIRMRLKKEAAERAAEELAAAEAAAAERRESQAGRRSSIAGAAARLASGVGSGAAGAVLGGAGLAARLAGSAADAFSGRQAAGNRYELDVYSSLGMADESFPHEPSFAESFATPKPWPWPRGHAVDEHGAAVLRQTTDDAKEARPKKAKTD